MTCCHLKSSAKPSTNADVKIFQKSKIIMIAIIIINNLSVMIFKKQQNQPQSVNILTFFFNYLGDTDCCMYLHSCVHALQTVPKISNYT